MSKQNKEKLYSLIEDRFKGDGNILYKLLDILDESTQCTGAHEQCTFIRNYLNSMDEEYRSKISKVWYTLVKTVVYVPWYNEMHHSNGGIVTSGDDGFYMDFPAWLTSRGTEFLINYFTFKKNFVLKFISDNSIPEKEYLYESISDAF